MSCESIRKQLTAYLDGELEGDRGSVVRGHLRGCEDCRKIAGDEAALRDGLRSLTPVDPPASMWAGVQAKLAAAEVRDAGQPAWRRALARWAPRAPQIGFAGMAVAAAIVFIVVRSNHHDATPTISKATHVEPVVIKPDQHVVTPPPPVRDDGDVTAELAAEPREVTASYAQAAQELRQLAGEARTKWGDDLKHEVDGKLAAFDKEVVDAKTERAKQKSYRAQIRYLQRVVIRDDVALASAGAP